MLGKRGVTERVNKIRFVGNIKREIRSRVVSTYVLEKNGEKPEKREETKESCDFCNLKVRVSLAFQFY